MKLRSRLGLAALRSAYRLEAALPALIDARAITRLNRESFARQADEWNGLAGEGLTEPERAALERTEVRGGRALCLGSGGGREAFAFARAGFSVVGIEQVAAMVEASRARAASEALEVRFEAGDMTAVDTAGPFDLIWIGNLCYGYVPTRRARVEWLSRLHGLLANGGRCLASFLVREPGAAERAWHPVLKTVARLAGNPGYQMGDRVDANPIFFRFFPALEIVGDEAREAGFTRVEYASPSPWDHFAILSR